MSDGQLDAVINNNGTLTIRGGGTLVGTLAMYHDNAVTYLESRDQLQGSLADGVAFMKDKVNGMYAVMMYPTETAARLTDAIDTADKAVKSFYGSTQQLSALTAEQVKSANKMTAKDKQLIEDAYTALMNLDQTAVQRVLATENYAALEASRQIVLVCIPPAAILRLTLKRRMFSLKWMHLRQRHLRRMQQSPLISSLPLKMRRKLWRRLSQKLWPMRRSMTSRATA